MQRTRCIVGAPAARHARCRPPSRRPARGIPPASQLRGARSPPREETPCIPIVRSIGPDTFAISIPPLQRACGGSERWAEEAARRAQHFAHRRFEEDTFVSGAGLGVRRPLRFLASRLDLDDEQSARLARILERLKLERAQASLDLRRAAADLADALEASEFTRAKVDSASALRADAARRVETAVATAIQDLHALLEPDQRARLAEFVRSGVIRI